MTKKHDDKFVFQKPNGGVRGGLVKDHTLGIFLHKSLKQDAKHLILYLI